MWLTRILVVALFISASTFPTNSQDMDYVGIPCKIDNDCNFSMTFLRCFQKSNSKAKDCQCRRNQFYDRTQKKCLIGVDSQCMAPTYNNKNPQECIPTAECVFQMKSELGTCTFKSELTTPAPETEKPELNEKDLYQDSPERMATREMMEEEIEEQETSTSTFRPLPFLTVNQQANENGRSHLVSMEPSLLGRSCTTHETCEQSRTFLKCSTSSKSGKQCVCSKTASFDYEKQTCRLLIGSLCNLPTDENRNPQRCVQNGKCIPHKDLRGSALTIGTCCDPINQQSCSEFGEITTSSPSHSTTMKTVSSANPQSQVEEQLPSDGDLDLELNHKSCQNHNDCRHSTTFLKCLHNSESPKKVCDCGSNNMYDIALKKCFLGLGSQCTSSEAENDGIQKCGSNLECSSGGGNTNNMNRNINNRKSNVGSCVCRHGSRKSSECDAYVSKEPLISPLEIVISFLSFLF